MMAEGWNGATILCIWSSKLPVVEPPTRERREKFLHRAEAWRILSAEDNWVLFKKRRLWFSTHACHGRPWGQRGMKWGYARNSHLWQAYSSGTEGKESDWRKCLYRLKASLVTEAQNSLSIAGKLNNIVVWLSTVTSLETDLWLSLHILTCWWVKMLTSMREVENKVLKDQLLFWKKQKYDELGLNASAGHTWSSQDVPGTKWIREIKRAIWRHLPKRWTSWKKSLRAQFGGTTTWWNLTTSRLYQHSRRGIRRENMQARSRRQLRFIIFWRRQRHRRSYVCHGFGSFDAQCWASENWAQIHNGYCEKVQNTISDLTATWEQCK